MVPKGEGTQVIGDWDSMGMRATNSQSMRFDCLVDHSEVIGAPGALPASGLFGNFLIGYLGVYLGIAEGALESLREYANHRVVPPSIEPMIADPLVSATVVRMEDRIKGSQALVGEALRAREESNKRATLRAVMRAKYDVAEGGLWITEQAMRTVGGQALLNSLPFGRLHRDALAGVLMPPSSQRCLRVIEDLDAGRDVEALNFQF